MKSEICANCGNNENDPIHESDCHFVSVSDLR